MMVLRTIVMENTLGSPPLNRGAIVRIVGYSMSEVHAMLSANRRANHGQDTPGAMVNRGPGDGPSGRCLLL